MLKTKRLYFANKICSIFPPTKFYYIKARIFKWAGVEIEGNVRIVSSVKIWGTGSLRIGDGTFIGHYTKILMGGSNVDIGRNVDISSMVTIINGTHVPYDIPNKAAGTGFSKNIIIGDGTWIGASSTLIAGCEIKNSSIVGAGSTVTKVLDEKGIYHNSGLTRVSSGKNK